MILKSYNVAKKVIQLTVSDVRMLGTATSNPPSSLFVSGLDNLGSIQQANEQKFIVLTSREYSSQGFLLGFSAVSTGRTVLISASSDSENLHTKRRLSFPCLFSKR